MQTLMYASNSLEIKDNEGRRGDSPAMCMMKPYATKETCFCYQSYREAA